MRKVLLDTSFILSCIRNKIDFFEEIPLMGIQMIIPEEVILEVERFKDRKTEADVALAMINQNHDKFEKIELGKGHVDSKIIEYANNKNDFIVGTLDKEIKEKLNGKSMVIREKKRLEIV
jgi:rRNA-processing protein FCF1